MMLGGLLFLMSLKNSADLFIWSLLGMLIGGAGLVFAVIGWVIYRSDRNREMS